jgi:hypothetical protein
VGPGPARPGRGSGGHPFRLQGAFAARYEGASFPVAQKGMFP